MDSSFRKFRDGDWSYKNRNRCGPPSVVSGEDLNTAMTSSPHPTVEESTEKCLAHRTTVKRQMHAFGFITKFDQWKSHQLKARQCEEKVKTSVSLLSRNSREPF